MSVPPGILFLIHALPRLVTPPLVFYLIKYVCEARFGYVFPIWLTTLGYLTSWLAAAIIIVKVKSIRKHMAAKAHGAVLPPVPEHKYPGNIDFILNTMKSDGNKIIGTLVTRISVFPQIPFSVGL